MRPIVFSCLAVFTVALSLAWPSAADETVTRGEYLVRIMDCGGCHTPGALFGKPDMSRYLGGADAGFELPGLGIFYPPNLTNDETGLKGWSEAEIMTAIRTGMRPDGRELAPVMPWHSYAALTDEDALALARYLKNTKPVSNDVPDPVGPGQKAPLPYLTMKMPG
jgi:mono/diheme cytochrome c family protein